MRHFIFDLGGVLKKKIHYEQIKDEPSVGPRLEGDLLRTIESGKMSIKEYVKTYANEFNKKHISYDEFVQNYYEIGEKYGGIFPDVDKVFQLLTSKGVKIYLLSNLHELCYDEIKDEFDLSIFEKMFLSYEMGCVKPDPIIYQKVIKEIGDDPKNMYFFDDKEKNVLAAQKEGMNAYVTEGNFLYERVSEVLKKSKED